MLSDRFTLRELIQHLGESGGTFTVSVIFEHFSSLKLDQPLADYVSSGLAHAIEDTLASADFAMEIYGDSILRCEPLQNGDLRIYCNEMVRWMLDCLTSTAQILSELVEKAGAKFAAIEARDLNSMVMWPPTVTAIVVVGPDGAVSSEWKEFIVYDTCGDECSLNGNQEARLKNFIEQSVFREVPGSLELEACDFEAEFSVGVPRLNIGECPQFVDAVIPSSRLDDRQVYAADLEVLTKVSRATVH